MFFSELGFSVHTIDWSWFLLLLLVSAADPGHGQLHEQGQHASWRGGRFQDHLSHTGILCICSKCFMIDSFLRTLHLEVYMCVYLYLLWMTW